MNDCIAIYEANFSEKRSNQELKYLMSASIPGWFTSINKNVKQFVPLGMLMQKW